MGAQAFSGLQIRLFGDAIDWRGLAHLLDLVTHPGHRVINGGFDAVRIKDGRGKHILKQFTGLGRVEHIPGLVDAEFFEDHRELLLQHFAHTELDRVLENEIDRPNRLGLADTVHTTDTPVSYTHLTLPTIYSV